MAFGEGFTIINRETAQEVYTLGALGWCSERGLTPPVLSHDEKCIVRPSSNIRGYDLEEIFVKTVSI